MASRIAVLVLLLVGCGDNWPLAAVVIDAGGADAAALDAGHDACVRPPSWVAVAVRLPHLEGAFSVGAVDYARPEWTGPVTVGVGISGVFSRCPTLEIWETANPDPLSGCLASACSPGELVTFGCRFNIDAPVPPLDVSITLLGGDPEGPYGPFVVGCAWLGLAWPPTRAVTP